MNSTLLPEWASVAPVASMRPATKPSTILIAGRCIERWKSGLRFVANHLDVVPVQANDERRIVVRVVVGAQAGRTVVLATRLKRGAMESIHLAAITGHKSQVKVRRFLVCLEQAERHLSSRRAELDAVVGRPLGGDSYAQRLQRLQEERLARRVVAHSEFDVVEHA